MAFSAKVQDVFSIPGKGTALWLTEVRGEPVEGEGLKTEIGEAVVLATGEPGIRDRSCLTGSKIPPYGAILTDLPMPDAGDLYDTTVQSTEQSS
ncbi:hypothetical protein M3P21_10665 [Ruegeria sp. 2012CJ41-6]|uniref:Uncharacterized protein n=1 Tax=Ruegeria spongiae TaxID=2942209 RepID=A0ABT0Q489_9RHOB|nr:hypothetical protein [Ruegeria spongiae]MCL6283993.1 hypothetical protein [Ruegeria spongiae]